MVSMGREGCHLLLTTSLRAVRIPRSVSDCLAAAWEEALIETGVRALESAYIPILG